MVEDMDLNFGLDDRVSEEAQIASEISNDMFFKTGKIGYRNFSAILTASGAEFNAYLDAMKESEESYEGDDYIIHDDTSLSMLAEEERVQ